MTIQADAIFEGGVLRPLVPLQLNEHEVVSLSITTNPQAGLADDEAAKQRSTLMAYVSKVESRPVDVPQDGLSNRDHDLLIYGK